MQLLFAKGESLPSSTQTDVSDDDEGYDDAMYTLKEVTSSNYLCKSGSFFFFLSSEICEHVCICSVVHFVINSR